MPIGWLVHSPVALVAVSSKQQASATLIFGSSPIFGLIVPTVLIRAELDRPPEAIRRDVDQTTKVLADRFEVSIAALGFR